MAFDISKFASQVQPPEASPRDIETVTNEILRRKQAAGNEILGIGHCLIEAKAMLSHGEWLPWLTERVEFSERTARNFMRLAREWTNRQALADLGAAKALTLLALPPEEREKFMEENHVVDGQEKSVIDMTSRELEKAIRERDEAQQAAEAAQAEARAAEDSRAKMETDMAALKRLHEAAREEASKAEAQARSAEEALKALREKPVDVAVMAVDQAALDKARAEGAAQMADKLEKAKEAQKQAEEQRKSAEEALAEARQKLEAAAAAEKKAALSGDRDFAAFEVLFGQAQEQVNKLHGLLLKVQGRGDGELAAKLRRALEALADSVRRCAE